MNKQTKLFLGVGIVAVAGYLYWKSTQPKKAAFLATPNTPIFKASYSGSVGNVTK